MAITTEQVQRLKSKGFDHLFDDHASEWRAIVENAIKYVDFFLPIDEPIRPGDLAKQITDAIRVSEAFKTHLEPRKLSQRFWADWFAEYIVERIYPTTTVERKAK